jgi:type II secretory pathway pseudopilin PulG
MLTLVHLRRSTGAEGGFTLVETLIAMVTGLVVSGALFAILEVSLHQSARLSDVAQATQLGRTAMTHVVDELHSACLSSGFTPIQEKSNENKLIFVDAYSKEAEIPSAREDAIVWEKEGGKESGTLTDYTYPSIGGSWPKFSFSSTATPASGVRIGEHIFKAELEANGKKETPPIFRYYAYTTKPSTSPTAPSSTLNEETLKGAKEANGLSSTEAATVASVAVSFKAAPSDGRTELGRGASLTNQMTFAFEAPSSESPIEAAPCE